MPDFTPKAIGQRIIADNHKNDHCTAEPIFLVEELKRTYGIDTDNDPEIAWLHSDEGNELSKEDAAIAEAFWRLRGEEPIAVIDGVAVAKPRVPKQDHHHVSDTLRRVGYHERWQFAQPFLTNAAAEHYIATQSHHHRGELRVYVDSGHSNPEWRALRRYFMEMGKSVVA